MERSFIDGLILRRIIMKLKMYKGFQDRYNLVGFHMIISLIPIRETPFPIQFSNYQKIVTQNVP
jgi:hypothetical protein